MDKVELITVEESYFIKGIGLVLSPSFDIPARIAWKPIKEIIEIQTPDGGLVSAEALFSVVHVNSKDPSVNIGKNRTILLSLKDVEKDMVPLGSIVYVDKLTKQTLTSEAPEN